MSEEDVKEDINPVDEDAKAEDAPEADAPTDEAPEDTADATPDEGDSEPEGVADDATPDAEDEESSADGDSDSDDSAPETAEEKESDTDDADDADDEDNSDEASDADTPTPEGETAEGETPEGETPEGETADGEQEGEKAEGETAEGETAEGEASEPKKSKKSKEPDEADFQPPVFTDDELLSEYQDILNIGDSAIVRERFETSDLEVDDYLPEMKADINKIISENVNNNNDGGVDTDGMKIEFQRHSTQKGRLDPDADPTGHLKDKVSPTELNARLAIRLMESPMPEINPIDFSEKVVLDSETPTPIVGQLFEQFGMVEHAFFTRRGGVSSGELFSLNAGMHAHDEMERVIENRRLALKSMNAKRTLKDLFLVRQRHTPLVYTVEEKDIQESANSPVADALVTNQPNVTLAVLSADCMPVMFLDPINHVIGIAHCGWRGALSGITTHTITAMESLGAHRSNIYASLGPCISQENYEVGQDLYSLFLAQDLSNKRFFRKIYDPTREVTNVKRGSIPAVPYYFDLQGYIAERLRPMGLKDVELVDLCTYGNEDLFFSHRRETRRGLVTGRQISMIGLTEELPRDETTKKVYKNKSHYFLSKVREGLTRLLPRYEEYEFVSNSEDTERYERVVESIKYMKERYGEVELEEEDTDGKKGKSGPTGPAEGPEFSEEEKRERLKKLGAAADKLKGKFVKKPRKPGGNPAASGAPDPDDAPEEAPAKKAAGKKSSAKKAKGKASKKAASKKAAAKKADDADNADDADDTEVDTAPEADAPEAETQTDAPDGDTPEADAPEADAPEADTPPAETAEDDAPQAETAEADAPEAETPQEDTSEADAPEGDAPETDADGDKKE